MRMVHHLRCELHLQLLATLPESLDSFFEGIGVLRVPVYMSARAHIAMKVISVPHHTLNNFPHHILCSWLALHAPDERLLCQRGGKILPCLPIVLDELSQRRKNMLQARVVDFAANVRHERECNGAAEMIGNFLARSLIRTTRSACFLEYVFPE
jgi:hypothetical protein